MANIKPTQDLVPLSTFRAHVTELLKQTQATGRPIIITQHGRGAGVLMSADEYEKLTDSQAYTRSITVGQAQLAAGEGIPHEQVAERFRRKVKAMKAARRKQKATA